LLVLKFLAQHVGARRLKWRQALRAIGAILAAMLDPKQRHTLLKADRTRDVTWIRATIEHLMAADPDLTLAEVEDVLRAAAGTAYLVGSAERFEVVIGFTAWHGALASVGVTAEQNRLALATGSRAMPRENSEI
jgi:hypothetical protein